MIDQVGLVFETAGYENLNRDQCRDLALKLFERLGSSMRPSPSSSAKRMASTTALWFGAK